MGDEQDPGSRVDPVAQLAQHAAAVPGVEGGRRLVGDDELGAGDERRGDKGALAQSARELVGALPQAGLGIRHARGPQRLEHPAPALAPRGEPVQAQGVADLVLDPAQGVQASQRILRDEARPGAADRVPGPSPSRRRLGEVAAAREEDAPPDRGSGGEQAEQRAGRDGLARSALPDERHALAGAQLEPDPVDHEAAVEVDREPVDASEYPTHENRSLRSKARPSTVVARPTARIMSPGKKVSHQALVR